MMKLVYKIMVLILLFSITAEITTPFFSDYNSFSLIMETQDTDEKKEKEVKDKNSSNTNFLPLIEMVTDFYLKNDLVNTLGFLSLHEMPPDQV